MNEKHIETIKNTAAQLTLFLLPLRKKLIDWTTHDYQWVLIILSIALMLRLPFITYPGTTEFDEVTYVNFALHTLHNLPFFQIHPPFFSMLLAEIARFLGQTTMYSIPMLPSQSFGDFPFTNIRYAIAGLGSLLPLFIYAIGRMLKYSPRVAALPALFIAIDSAFIIFSRTILPDTPLLFLNFLALTCTYLCVRTKNSTFTALLLITIGTAIGCALAIKWLALGVLGIIWLLFLLERQYVAIIISAFIAFMTYTAIFVAFFFYFPTGGHIDPMLPAFDTPLIRDVSFPKTDNISDVLAFLPKFHATMLSANSDEDIAKYILQSPGPLTWPASRSSIDFWRSDDGRKITFQGNALLWMISLLLLCFHIGWILWHMTHERKWPLERYETILFAGYVLNYLPFFFIDRSMYLYHYFTAIIFLFLMIPMIAPRMIHCIALLSRDRLFAVTLACATLFLIVIDLFTAMPTIYGF